MADTRSPEQRKRIMQAVGSKDTKPEIAVRSLLHRLGYRYRLHRKELPGSPDIVFKKRMKVIFVHGCFWHSHGCQKGQAPKSRMEYWGPKLAENRQRDARNVSKLCADGWQVLTVWQCETKDLDNLEVRLRAFLDDGQVQSLKSCRSQ